jgi:hypothetical protein
VRGLRTDESLDRLPLMLRAQVRVPLCHHQRLVTEDLLYRVEVDARHDQATRRSVPQVVKAEVGDLSRFPGYRRAARDDSRTGATL